MADRDDYFASQGGFTVEKKSGWAPKPAQAGMPVKPVGKENETLRPG